jgi:DNA-binding NtrC family response regulator
MLEAPVSATVPLADESDELESVNARPSLRLLIVDDREVTCQQLQEILQRDGLQVEYRTDGAAGLRALQDASYSILITDLQMPGMSGMDLVRAVHEHRIPVTIIVIAGHGSISEAVEAIRLGAYDFLTKPVEPSHLQLVIDRALRERALQDELAQLRAGLQQQYAFQNILSKNARMHAIFDLISNLAHTTSTVLIEGETGTGKEQVARAVQSTASERTGPFVAINCAAVPETLLESELFGHEKGAFTSAVGLRTIFLDEIGDMPLPMQAKLLRVLQERSFERIGGAQTIHVDVRVITASNRSLPKLVKDGKFREDLYYRLNVIKIDLPPLRDRREDIPLLATHFISKYKRAGDVKQIAPEAMQVMLNYSWPGNVRELENAIERGCVTSRDPFIRIENLPPEVLSTPRPNTAMTIDLKRPLADYLHESATQIEREYIRKALEETRGQVGQCAKLCGLSRRSISVKMAAYHLDKDTFKMGNHGVSVHHSDKAPRDDGDV